MAAPTSRARIVQFVVAALVALFALKTYELRNSLMMMHTSSRTRFPGFYVRNQTDEFGAVRCRNVHGAYVPDARAYSVDPATHQAAQTTDSCEDVRMSTLLGIAVISCDPGRVKWNAVMGPLDEPHKRGAVWVLDYKDSSAEPYMLALEGFPDTHDFHPLGMSLLELSKKLARLFIVNHRAIGSTVEVVDLQNVRGVWRARYVRTLYDTLGTHAANSIQALDRNEVLVTNMHTAQARTPALAYVASTLERLYGPYAKRFAHYFDSARNKERVRGVENVVGGGWIAHVAFVDAAPASAEEDLDAWSVGVEAHAVARRIPFANGISITPGHRYVVAASTSLPGVLLFPVQRWTEHGEPDWQSPGVLGQRIVVPTPFFADNVDVVPPKPAQRIRADDPLAGAKVVVAGHPSLPDLADMMHNIGSEEHRGASWAVEITYTGTDATDDAPFPADARLGGLPRGWRVRTLMQTDGRPYSYLDRRVEMPTSCGVAWDDTGEGLGTLIVTGLYSPAPLVCQGVYN